MKKKKPTPAPPISSEQVMKLLERRHSKDVFVPECKDGPTQSGSHVRLDAWVMPKSWAHPSVLGKECVSRGLPISAVLAPTTTEPPAW